MQEDNSEAQATQENGSSKLPLIPIIISVAALLVIGILAVTLKSPDEKSSNQTSQTIPTSSSEITISNQGFTPQTLRIKAGTQVTWKNTDKKPHHIVSDPHPTHTAYPDMNDQEALNTNESYAFVFDSAGTYTYHDHINPKFTGTIVVE
jgi:plastocyanin